MRWRACSRRRKSPKLPLKNPRNRLRRAQVRTGEAPNPRASIEVGTKHLDVTAALHEPPVGQDVLGDLLMDNLKADEEEG